MKDNCAVDDAQRTKYRAVKYIRSSSSDELENPNIIAKQTRSIDTFIEKHPDILVVRKRLMKTAAVFFNRPAFMEMVGNTADGLINCATVKDLSRLNHSDKLVKMQQLELGLPASLLNGGRFAFIH